MASPARIGPMERLVALCVRHRFVVIFAVLFAGALGVRAARHLPVDAVPDVTNVQVQILTDAPALGPIEIEQYITVPVEAALAGLPALEEIRSLSRTGLSAVTVVFEEGTDIYFARQRVAERLSEARDGIPDGFGTPTLGPISTGLGEIYHFEVRGRAMCPPDTPAGAVVDGMPCQTPMSLRALLDWQIGPFVRATPGVVEVNAFGGELMTYEVRVDPGRLAALELSLRDVFDALERNNRNAGGGTVVRGGEQRLIRGEALLGDLDAIRAVRLATRSDGTPVQIRDVAEVTLAPMLRQGAVTRDGRGEVVTGTIMMLMGQNAGEVTAAVRDRLATLAPSLPAGVTIEPFYDRAALVDRTVRTVAINLIEGGALVIAILLLMLGDVRAGLLVASVIPLALLGTFIVMDALGVSGNLMSLGALDFGLIIDGAIVVVENITRRLAHTGATGRAAETEVRRATAEVLRPVFYGTAIIMLVYVPVLALQGVEGKMFRPMATVVLSALTAALVLALTWVPGVAGRIFARGVRETEPALPRLARRLYAPLLARLIDRRALALITALGAIGGGAYLASTMGAEFVPRLDEGAIAMQAIRPPSVALAESVEATTRIEATLRERFPAEIDTIISRTGRAEIATDPMGVELSDIYLMLHPPEQWTAAPDKAALVAAIDRVLRDEVPGQNYVYSQPIELRTNELISGARADVAISITGPDLDGLRGAGERVSDVLRRIDGAADIAADAVAGLPVLRIVIDRPAAARHGVDAADILDAVSAMGGRPVGVVFDGPARHPLQVRLAPAARADRDAIAALLVTGADGARVPLATVARVIPDEGPAVVNRHDGQRRLVVQVNVRGRDLAGFVAEARERIRTEAGLPPGYVVDFGGQFENLARASERLTLAVPAALALILLILYTAFGALRPALIIYLAIPMAAAGGVAALWLRDMPLSISAAVGFIALSGIAVLNGVVMVSCIRDLQRDGLTRREAAEQGARLRLRAVLTTALTDGLGFLPMALSAGAGAEVQRPLATVVVGGLVTATLLTLFVLPTLYAWLGGDDGIEPSGDAIDAA